MKILFLNYEYPPLGGGAANATKYLLHEFAHMENLEVHLVTSSVDSAHHFEKFPIGKVVIHRIPVGKHKGNIHYQSVMELLRYFLWGMQCAEKLAIKERFDVTCAFFTFPSGLMARLLKWRCGIPYIVSLRGSDVPGYSERFAALYGFLRPLARFVWRGASSVVANSRGLRELAQKTDPKQEIDIIMNGVAIAEYGPVPEFSTAGPLRLLLVSRLTPRKGIRYLLDALPLIESRHGQGAVMLTIIGDGHEREALQAKTREGGLERVVSFTGALPHEVLPERYRAADVFVLPSQNEGMSNTMLEALASGLPIVTTVTGGTDELVTDGENGFHIAMRSPEDIAEKIGRFLEKRELLERMGATSRARAEAMSWRAVAEQYAGLFERTMERSDEQV